MIIDAHVALDSTRYPVERALRALSEARIGSAVIFPDARSTDPEIENAYVLRVAQEHGLYPFYYLGGNPWTDTRPDELVPPDNLEEYAGIRWHRWVGEAIDREGNLDRDELEWAVNLLESPEFESLAAAAAHYNMPIMVEESLAVTLEMVLRFPSLDFIVPHLGAQSGGQTNVMRAFWDQPNVYFDTSLSLLDEATLSRVGIERILFGSGFPEGDPEAEIDKIDRLPISEDLKEGIYGDNLQRLLEAYSHV
jgi:predicted TIM-barrel fold metal-dependent hydrolase